MRAFRMPTAAGFARCRPGKVVAGMPWRRSFRGFLARTLYGGRSRPVTGKPALRGFTLIEVLVVVVITGVLVAALTLAVGNNGARELENASERFQALLGHACNEAELGGREIGAALDEQGFAFKRLDGSEWRDFGRDDELRARRWPQGARIELAREGRPLRLAANASDAPQLVCFSSGELTPFTLTLNLGDPPVRYRVQGEDDGRLKHERIDTRR